MRWVDSRRWQANEFYARFGPRRRRTFPILVLWRWRWEMALAAGIGFGLYRLAGVLGAVGTAGLTLAVAAGVWSCPPVRRHLTSRARAVVVQHRLRVGMVQAGVLSWSGWLPAILWTTPTSDSVRVVLWCPAGVDVHAFHGTRELLAAACWAVDVEVSRHSRWASLIVLQVMTRPAW